MTKWDSNHQYGFFIKGTKAEIDEVLSETREYDSSATMKMLDGQSFIYCNGDTAAMMCRLKAASAALVRKPRS